MQEKIEKREISIVIKERNCNICNIKYMPGWTNSKYCPKCRVLAKKKQDLDANRRKRERDREALKSK